MSTISIIGLGTYAHALGNRAVEAGHAVEVIGRDAATTKDLADELGGGATAGTFGTAPAGDIVVLAVPYASAVPVVAQYGTREPARSSSISPTPSPPPTTPSWTPLMVLPARRRSPKPSRRARTS